MSLWFLFLEPHQYRCPIKISNRIRHVYLIPWRRPSLTVVFHYTNASTKMNIHKNFSNECRGRIIGLPKSHKWCLYVYYGEVCAEPLMELLSTCFCKLRSSRLSCKTSAETSVALRSAWSFFTSASSCFTLLSCSFTVRTIDSMSTASDLCAICSACIFITTTKQQDASAPPIHWKVSPKHYTVYGI